MKKKATPLLAKSAYVTEAARAFRSAANLVLAGNFTEASAQMKLAGDALDHLAEQLDGVFKKKKR